MSAAIELHRCDECGHICHESVIHLDDHWKLCPDCLDARETNRKRWALRCTQPGTLNPVALDGVYRDRQDAENALQRSTDSFHGLGFTIRDVLDSEGNLERVRISSASTGWTIAEYEVLPL
jgi:hypothetical protein